MKARQLIRGKYPGQDLSQFLNQFSKSRTLGINLHLEKKDSNNNSINNRYAIKEFLIIDKNIYKSNCIKESKIMER